MANINKDVDEFIKTLSNSINDKVVYSYLTQKNNLVFAQDSEILLKKRNDLLIKQRTFDDIVKKELSNLDSIGVPMIGLKGIFIKDLYYTNADRNYNDIDILVDSDNAYKIYKKLVKLEYRIEPKTMYDNPLINMNVIPRRYMENTQTLMLINKRKNIPIDLHCNLNITNAHFKKTATKFKTKDLFENAIPFEDYENIKILDLHDNLCFLFKHLLKHHVFYGKTQTGLSTPIQHVVDIGLIFNSSDFDEKILFEKVLKYNVIPEAVFCINLYNKFFKNCRQINISNYLKELKNIEFDFKWKPVLLASMNMNIKDLMIGNYKNAFPKLQKAVEISQALPGKTLGWLVQAFIISLNISKFLN